MSMHGSESLRSAESMIRVGTFFVATRADWQAWLEYAGEAVPERVLAVQKRPIQSWGSRRIIRLSGRGN
ncbi:MAG: hypothetical protein HQL95_04675 [Magnetococcales bacterium]|nr:hypothetical protein [Magnetococcales bacterium]